MNLSLIGLHTVHNEKIPPDCQFDSLRNFLIIINYFSNWSVCSPVTYSSDSYAVMHSSDAKN